MSFKNTYLAAVEFQNLSENEHLTWKTIKL